jgi:serine/threonine-protein kinase
VVASAVTLSGGTRVGHYEIVQLIGAGGMGQVYRARDPKLGRDVAIKVLPPAFALDRDRLSRLEREARLLASLNHPNIAHVYGLEDTSGTRAVVMELVDGDTLADRIARGAIPITEALPIARQIAEALEAAHDGGVIHRDLKPANIKVREDGAVKVLDFGLATSVGPDLVEGLNSPTLTARATKEGVILGTPAYMSPEQAKGKPADKRSDVWAFGCVFYEMLTGMRAFEGAGTTDVLGAVLHLDPNWSALPSTLPPAIRRLLQGCLSKDRRSRVADISTALFVLDNAMSLAGPSPTDGTSVLGGATVRRSAMWRRVAVFSLAAATLIVALATIRIWPLPRPAAPRVTRTILTAAGTIDGNDRDLAITPDGTRVIYLGANGTKLFVRRIDQLEPTVLVSSSWLRGVFTSSDGEWVGYVENGRTLKKVPITGGVPVTVLTIRDGYFRGATWLPDDTIIFATTNAADGLQRVAGTGGAATVLARPTRDGNEARYGWPESLPDGRAVLFTILPATGGLDAAQVAVLDLTTRTRQILVQGGSHAHYVGSGHLVYAAGGTLRAVAFNLARLAVQGTSSRPVLPRLLTTAQGAADVAVATDGTLVYMDAVGGTSLTQRTPVWVDREGREQPLGAPPRGYLSPRLSPDGTRVALTINDQTSFVANIWIWNLARATMTPLTFGSPSSGEPVWTTDSRQVVVTSGPDSRGNLFLRSAEGTGAAQRLTDGPNMVPTAMTHGRSAQVVFQETVSTQRNDLMLLTLAPPWRVTPLLTDGSNHQNGVVSPDGRWLAYDSDTSGRSEVYVRPFPNVGDGQWQVSVAGGMQPLWSHEELFYVTLDSVLAVPVTHSDTWRPGTPKKVVEGRYVLRNGYFTRNYDVSADGQRFLLLKRGGGDPSDAPPQIIVVQHFDEELKRLVPTK